MARLWFPKRLLVSPAALSWETGREVIKRCAASNVEIVRLKSDRLNGLPKDYRDAKTTMAVVVASPSRRRLQPIPPSADFRFDLAEGCPAHCSYCYLAGSLAGPPIIRVYANLEEIFAELPPALGTGEITSAKEERREEGTTFECSCYTDPLGIEHLTGQLKKCVEYFGRWSAPAQLRFTTKFTQVGELLKVEHHGRTRIRFSVNARSAQRFEGGAPPVSERLAALRSVARAGYPVGLTVAPILRLEFWRQEYAALFADVAKALSDIENVDLTIELITHRFTEKSKIILTEWYPGSSLEMDEATRTKKMTKFGSAKYVFPKAEMQEMKVAIHSMIDEALPFAKILYWT